MTEVRIRHENDAEATKLGEASLTEGALDEVFRLVKAWGLTHDGVDVDTDELFGQFALRDGRAYFELVIAE